MVIKVSAEYTKLPQVVGTDGSLANLLIEWEDLTRRSPTTRFVVDLSGIGHTSLRTHMTEVVTATGHFVGGVNRIDPIIRSTLPITDLVLSETIFVDTETDIDKRQDYLTKYQVGLKSMNRLKIPQGAVHIHITYCSIDKVDDVLVLSKRITRLNRYNDGTRFLLMLYKHPKEGYPPAKSGRPAAIRLPNKHAPFNNMLAEKPLTYIEQYRALPAAERFYRLALDDDDAWINYGIGEVIRIGSEACAQNGRSLKAIGFANQILYYANSGRVDIAELRPAMNGSKFFTSQDWDKIRHHSPFELPEYFSSQIERRHRALGIDLRMVRNNRPIFIYVRGHATSISQTSKTSLYQELKASSDVGSIEEVFSFVEEYSYLGEEEKPLLTIDPPSLEARGKMSENDKTLWVTTNVHELVASQQLSDRELSSYKMVLKLRRNEVWEELTFHLDDEISASTEDLSARVMLTIVNREGETIESAWVRGQAAFLS